MCKFSIIVPCYNIEPNVPKLFQMLHSRDYTDYEVIFVDDGSKDSSFETMKTLKSDYANYLVFQTVQNGGPGPARNLGIEQAQGEYILFCDSDDEFDIACLPVIDEFLVLHPDADMVVFSHEIIRGGKRIKCDPCSSYADSSVVPPVDIICGNCAPWAKVYKSSIIKENQIRFPARMTGEDTCFVVNYAVYVKKVYKLNRVFYRYIMNKGSVTHTKRNDFNQKTTFELLQPIYRMYFPEIEIEMFANTHLLTKVKQMTDAKCKSSQIKAWLAIENKKYPNWIKHVNYGDQSLYRKLIYKAMYANHVFFLKSILLLRRLIY